MFAQMLWLSSVIVGINVGWRPLDEGGMEYIIQLDPQTVEALKAGKPVFSDVPPGAGEVRAYKIVMGEDKPPRISPSAASAAKPLPRAFWPDKTEKPLTADSASFIDSDQNAAKNTSKESSIRAPKGTMQGMVGRSGEGQDGDAANKPWLPLILASLCLFASLGGNAYLTWIFADLRRRYRALLSQQSRHGDSH